MAKQSYAQPLVDAIYDSLSADSRVSLIGNRGWLARDGKRARFDQQPVEAMALAEACAEGGSAATGVGAAMAGMRPFVDLGTGSFSYLAWSQVTNEAAISYYMSGGRISVPVTFHLLHGVRGGGRRSTATARKR
jgi:pyruvate dehydrogenase E1 component beta subunit